MNISGSLAGSTLTIASGGTLSGHGSVGNVTILSGGSLTLGGSAGVFTSTGNLTLSGGSYTLLEISSLAAYDHLDVAGQLTAGGRLEIRFADGLSVTDGTTFNLLNAGSYAGGFSDFTLPTLSGGYEWDLSLLSSSGMLSVTQLTAIPEPAQGAAVIGLIAMVALGVFRRNPRRVPPQP